MARRPRKRACGGLRALEGTLVGILGERKALGLEVSGTDANKQLEGIFREMENGGQNVGGKNGYR